MLRRISTISLSADDLPAATRWYTDVLGVEPYFTSDAAGRGSAHVEFRIGDYQHELGIIDRLVSLGAKQLEAVTERGPGFVTASVVDPFGNVLGIIYNRRYLDIPRNRSAVCDPLRAQESACR